MFRLSAMVVLASVITFSGALADGVGLEGTWQIGAYRVTIKNAEDENTAPVATLTVEQGGKTIYSIQNAALWLNPEGFFGNPREMSYEDSNKPHRIGEGLHSGPR